MESHLPEAICKTKLRVKIDQDTTRFIKMNFPILAIFFFGTFLID